MTGPVRLRARLPALIGAVRRALTDATAVRHRLAEHAETGTEGHRLSAARAH